MQVNKRVAVVSKRLPHYRVAFHEQVRANLRHYGIEYQLVYGAPTGDDLSKSDSSDIPWACKITNKQINLFGIQLVWQPCLHKLKRCDLVIAAQANSLLINFWLLLKQPVSKTKFAFWGHGKNFQANCKHSFSEKIKKLVAVKAYWWFAYNDFSADIIRQLGFAHHKITAVQNAIDSSELIKAEQNIAKSESQTISKSLGITSDNIGLYIGSIYPLKRLPFLIESCCAVKKSIPDFHLVIIGDGPQASWLRQQADRIPWLHFIGPKFGKQRVPYFQMAKAVLMPAGVGLGIVDAFALLRPLITTATDSHGPEISYLKDGFNGIMVQQRNNVNAYSSAITQVFTDESLRLHLIEGCRQSREKYTIEHMANNFSRGIVQALGIENTA